MGRVLDYRGKSNRKMCSLYLSLMDKFDVKLPEFGRLARTDWRRVIEHWRTGWDGACHTTV